MYMCLSTWINTYMTYIYTCYFIDLLCQVRCGLQLHGVLHLTAVHHRTHLIHSLLHWKSVLHMQLVMWCLCTNKHWKSKIKKNKDCQKQRPEKSFLKKRRRWEMLHSWGTMMFLCFATLKGHLTGGAQKYRQNQVCSHETWFFLWWIVLYHHACTLICMHVGYHKYSLRLGSFVCLGICCVVGVRWWL